MEGSGRVLALHDYIKNVDQSSLPRILQVCSGIYFQGSVYEISGCEVCLSTGDLVKITGIKLLSVSCEDINHNTSFELPLNYLGQFRLVPEDLPYNTIEEVVSLLPVGVDAFGSFTFYSKDVLIIGDLTVPAGTNITLLSVELDKDGESFARCQLTGRQKASAEVHIPFSCHGEFYESQNDRGYSLYEIMNSSRLCRRRFYKMEPKKNHCVSPLFFNPIYEIQGIMHMRKNTVMFPSTLEVDVIDVTDEYKHITFVTPLSLPEVAAQPNEAFPTMAEVLEGPVGNPFFCCNWFKELQKGKHLVLHMCIKTHMVLASNSKGRKTQQYFLLSESYGGQIRKRAREFGSVYDVYMAFTVSPGLRISVTRHFEGAEEEGVPALSAGEQLQVLRSRNKLDDTQSVESLICKRIEDEEDDNEENMNESSKSEVCLPLFTPVNFVEKLLDKKKYTLVELVKNVPFPLDVKVVSPDKTLEKDPLTGLASLRLEDALEETTVIASLLDTPDRCFELPVRWLHMSLSFIPDPLPRPDMRPGVHLQTVTAVTDHFYHEYHKLTEKPRPPPPPRPPKRTTLTLSSQKGCTKPEDAPLHIKSSPTAKLECSSWGQTKPPPLPREVDVPPPLVPRKSVSESLAIPNMYVKPPRHHEKPHDPDSNHDYEPVEDMLTAIDHVLI